MQTTIASLSAFSALVLGGLILCGVLMLAGGWWILKKGRGSEKERRTQGWLLIGAALFMIANALLWGLPMPAPMPTTAPAP